MQYTGVRHGEDAEPHPEVSVPVVLTSLMAACAGTATIPITRDTAAHHLRSESNDPTSPPPPLLAVARFDTARALGRFRIATSESIK
jgi:hypothetical protein